MFRLLLALFLTAPWLARGGETLPLGRIALPPGFAIELLARVPNARQMALGSDGDKGHTLFVGSMREGKVHAL